MQLKTPGHLFALALAVPMFGAASMLAGRQVPASPQTAPAEQAAPGKPHAEIPDTKGEICLVCHDGLDKAAVVHAPVAAGECTSCHEFGGKGDAMTVKLARGATSASTGALCVTCHKEVGQASNGEGGHGPAAAGECGTCHRPHGSDHPSLLTAPQVELCTGCHDDVAGQLKLATVHKPAAAACAMCHNPHGSVNPSKIREAVNSLCLACHLVGAGAGRGGGQAPALFGRPVPEALAPLLAPQSRVALDPLRRRNHPIIGHPVTGPKDPLKESRPFTCVSCHGPHGTEGPGLKRFSGDDPSGFCVRCHK